MLELDFIKPFQKFIFPLSAFLAAINLAYAEAVVAGVVKNVFVIYIFAVKAESSRIEF